MKPRLRTHDRALYHYEDKVLVGGRNPHMMGDCSMLEGNCTGVYGFCNGIRGNIDNCELTDEERKVGVDVRDLICNDDDEERFAEIIESKEDK